MSVSEPRRVAHSSMMEAIVLDAFGPAEAMHVARVPVPEVGPSSVLIRVEAAGIGAWDPFEGAGGYAEMTGAAARFPYVLGSDGAGVVVAVGEGVRGFSPGEAVYAAGFLNPAGGFYAGAVAVEAALVARRPGDLGTVEAAGLAGAGLTALRGLDEALGVRAGEGVVIVGASGAVGHLAVQLAVGRGARVLAVASGADGVALCRALGAAAVVDGRGGDVAGALRAFGRVDAALLLAGGAAAASVAAVAGGRVAHPTGVAVDEGVSVAFNGEPDGEIMGRLDAAVRRFGVRVVVGGVFEPGAIAAGHAALGRHHVGKLVLDTRSLAGPGVGGGGGVAG